MNCILRGSKISLEQKVLEILSLHPQITDDQLLKWANEKDGQSWGRVISLYSPILHKPMIVGREIYHNDGLPYDERSAYSNIVLHNTVIMRQDANRRVEFELSLFGIMFVLTLIRYNEAGKLENGLYYNTFSSEGYFKKIADNYKQRLPLIFGKWYLLKKVLGSSMISNFDIILEREVRAKQLQISISQRGNKEFYESIDSLSKSTRNEMIKIQSVGLDQLLNYLAGNIYPTPDMTKVQPLIYKLLDISALLSPLDYDPASYVEAMKGMNHTSGKPRIDSAALQAVAREYELEAIEKAFADVISLYYFFNLLSDSDAINQPRKYDHTKKVSEAINSQIDNYYPLSRTQIANLIFSEDEDIRKWLSDWLKDILNHEHNKTLAMGKILDQIGLP